MDWHPAITSRKPCVTRLCEIVERHSLAMWDAATDQAAAVAGVLREIGGEAHPPLITATTTLIDLDTLPARARTLLRKVRRAGLFICVRDVTEVPGITALECLIIDTDAEGREMVHAGSGAHPDARVAITRAISEAAQSRVGHIQGGREDLGVILARESSRRGMRERLSDYPERPFSSLVSYESDTVDSDIAYVLSAMRSYGFTESVVVDLSKPELGVPVVRLVVGGAENWSTFFSHGHRAAIGERVMQRLRYLTDTGLRLPVK